MVELNPKHQKTLIVLVGPTAVGKTSVSIEFAKEFHCPILSFDSRQFYKEMSIGTAKPTTKELSAAKHYFINSRSVKDLYTAGMFEQDAVKVLDDVFKDHDYCIAVGGSGLYINAVCYGIDDIPKDETIRKRLYNRWQNEGLEVLQKEVKQIDPDYYVTADMKNPRRVMRALEVFEITGKTFSSYRTKPKKQRNFKTVWIGLEMELDELYDRINRRVDQMIEQGLVEEVKKLLKYKDVKAMKTVGYRELIDHFDNEITLEKAVELIKRNSRRYARKQFTWFRKNQEIQWFEPHQTKQIIDCIKANKCK